MGVRFLNRIDSDFGGGYLLCGSLVREVGEKSRHQLALAGKLWVYVDMEKSYQNLFLHLKSFL